MGLRSPLDTILTKWGSPVPSDIKPLTNSIIRQSKLVSIRMASLTLTKGLVQRQQSSRSVTFKGISFSHNVIQRNSTSTFTLLSVVRLYNAMVGRMMVQHKDLPLKVPDLEDCCRCTRPYFQSQRRGHIFSFLHTTVQRKCICYQLWLWKKGLVQRQQCPRSAIFKGTNLYYLQRS